MFGPSKTLQRFYRLVFSFPTLAEFNSQWTKPPYVLSSFFEFEGDKEDSESCYVSAFDAVAFAEWYNKTGMGHGADCACRFVLSVWNPTCLKDGDYKGVENFDLHEALGCWDNTHRAAFAQWTADPFWP